MLKLCYKTKIPVVTIVSENRTSHTKWGYLKETQTLKVVKLSPSNIALLLQQATQKYGKLKVYWTMLLSLLSLLFLCLLLLVLPAPFSTAEFFSSWRHSSAESLKILNVTSDHSCHKYFLFLVWKWLEITTCIKNRVYNNFNLCYFMSSIIESLNNFFFCP